MTENIKQEMSRLNISILGICKTLWANNRDFVNDKHWIIHTGSDKNERGVGLILDQDLKKCLLEYCQLSERIIVVKLNGKPFNISNIVVYAPTAQSTEEQIEK